MNFFGHQKQYKDLIFQKEKGRFPLVQIFYGPEGIGKKRVASSLIQYFFCTDLNQDKNLSSPDLFGDTAKITRQACESCASCRKILQNQHPDFFIIEALTKKIVIDQIRDIQKKIYKAPLEAPFKFVLIDNAQQMTIQAANSLLKTLEEPPEKTYFILVSPSLFSILPTIRSRSQSQIFRPPAFTEALDFLVKESEIAEKEASQILQMAEGSPGLALQYVEKEVLQAYKDLKSCFKGGLKFSLLTQQIQKWLQSDLDFKLLLEVLKKSVWNQGEKDWKSLERLDKITQSQNDLSRNVNPALIVENLMMNF